MLETRSHRWHEVGLGGQLSGPRYSREAVRRARLQLLVLVPVLGAVLAAYHLREELFGVDTPVRVATVVALLVIGWALAREVGRAMGPQLFRRLDPGTAGTVGFLIRLLTVVAAIVVALRIAGLQPQTLAVGGAFTAVIVGLAAQQTFGNLFAGMVLLSARPFRVGDRVRLQGGGLAGQLEGVVSSLGLLYTTFAQGDDQVMVPNSVVLNVAVVPLREPPGVDLRARLRPGITPSDVQRVLEEHIRTPVRGRPKVTLEEMDGEARRVERATDDHRTGDGAQRLAV
jgi:small conductance mechanosensitive channel